MWTDEQNAELAAKLARENAELAEWSAGVQAGTIRLEGAERDAMRAGFWDGRKRATEDARQQNTAGYTARERIAYGVGYGEGRAMPAHTADTEPPTAAELIRQLRERRNPN